jgi:hypothetical protein
MTKIPPFPFLCFSCISPERGWAKKKKKRASQVFVTTVHMRSVREPWRWLSSVLCISTCVLAYTQQDRTCCSIVHGGELGNSHLQPGRCALSRPRTKKARSGSVTRLPTSKTRRHIFFSSLTGGHGSAAAGSSSCFRTPLQRHSSSPSRPPLYCTRVHDGRSVCLA